MDVKAEMVTDTLWGAHLREKERTKRTVHARTIDADQQRKINGCPLGITRTTTVKRGIDDQ